MNMTVQGCGHNGFSQLDGFKCLNLDDLSIVVSQKDCIKIVTDQRKKVVMPEVLIQLNKEYCLHNILFTWSRIAVTLKRNFSDYTSIITGFNSSKAQEKDIYGGTIVLHDHIVAASNDTNILLCEEEDTAPNKILFENSADTQTTHISLPSKTRKLQIVHGNHREFVAACDSLTFGKLCTVDTLAARNDNIKNYEDKGVIHLEFSPIDSGIQIKEISCGKEHTLILSQFGSVYSYGFGSRGQLGHCSVEPESSPRLLAALEGVRMRSVCAGGWHSASLSEFGDLYMWGWNESGQLGLSTMSEDGNNYQPAVADECVGIQAQPWCITLPEDLSVTAVACGSRHTVLLTDTGRIFTSGWNAYGQLGLGNTETHKRFTEVAMIKGCCIKIFAGQWNSIFVCDANKQ